MTVNVTEFFSSIIIHILDFYKQVQSVQGFSGITILFEIFKKKSNLWNRVIEGSFFPLTCFLTIEPFSLSLTGMNHQSGMHPRGRSRIERDRSTDFDDNFNMYRGGAPMVHDPYMPSSSSSQYLYGPSSHRTAIPERHSRREHPDDYQRDEYSNSSRRNVHTVQ